MYNRYIPNESQYTPVDRQPERPPISRLGGIAEGKLSLKGLLKTVHLEKLDSGDLLLLLIVLLLWKDSEDTDLLLALGAALLLGGGEEE